MRRLTYRLIVGALLTLPLVACSGDDGGDDDDIIDAAVTIDGQADIDADTGPDAYQGALCGTLALPVTEIAVGAPATGTTAGASLTAPYQACYEQANGAEAVFTYTLDHTADLVWNVDASFDLVVFIRSDCDGTDGGNSIPEPACADGGTTGPEQAELLDATAGTYYFFVDGWETTDVGAFTATLLVREIVAEGEACDESVRCATGLYCTEAGICGTETSCNDFVDQDSDGLFDCQDPTTCQGTDACVTGAGAPGVACAGNNECDALDGDPACITEAGIGYPGGYCSEFCDLASPECPADSLCVDVGLGLCYHVCALDTDCRAGYGCTDVTGGRVCMPRCTDDAQCAVLGFCNLESGFCTATDEDCADTVDNDEDALVDCEDADCADDASCGAAVAAVCEAPPPVLVLDSATSGDTTGGTSVFVGSCTGHGGALETVYTLTPGAAGETGVLTVTLSSATDQGFYLRTACADAASELMCQDMQYGGTDEVASTIVAGGTPLALVVDGYGTSGEAGPFTVTASYTTVSAVETEPNDDIATANAWVEGTLSQIAPSGDMDFVSITVPGPASSLAAEVTEFTAGACAGSALDSEVEILAADGTQLAFNDDIGESTGNYCSSTTASALAAGTYYVRVASSQMYSPSATFLYRLVLTVTP